MTTTRRLILSALVTVTLPTVAPGAMAQSDGNWPNRPIRFITPYPPGGSSDIICRFVGERVAKLLGQPVVVENKPGAGATLGTSYAARQAPDGYSFFVGPTATVAVAPYMKKVDYTYESFEPVAKLASSYGLITTYKDAPYSDYKGLVAYAKAHPGKLTFATNGVGSIVHMTAVLLHKAADIQLNHVPYKGAAEAQTDLMGGRIDLMYDPVTAPRVKSGDLKGLATTSTVRNPQLPDIPTLKEQGFDMDSPSWFALFAPKGAPPALVSRMADAVRQVLDMPGVREQLLVSALYPTYEDPAQFSKTLTRDVEALRDVIQKEGLKAE